MWCAAFGLVSFFSPARGFEYVGVIKQRNYDAIIFEPMTICIVGVMISFFMKLFAIIWSSSCFSGYVDEILLLENNTLRSTRFVQHRVPQSLIET